MEESSFAVVDCQLDMCVVDLGSPELEYAVPSDEIRRPVFVLRALGEFIHCFGDIGSFALPNDVKLAGLIEEAELRLASWDDLPLGFRGGGPKGLRGRAGGDWPPVFPLQPTHRIWGKTPPALIKRTPGLAALGREVRATGLRQDFGTVDDLWFACTANGQFDFGKVLVPGLGGVITNDYCLEITADGLPLLQRCKKTDLEEAREG